MVMHGEYVAKGIIVQLVNVFVQPPESRSSGVVIYTVKSKRFVFFFTGVKSLESSTSISQRVTF